MRCSNCNSEKIIPYAQLMDHGDASSLQFAVNETPNAIIFKGWHLFNLAGTVCCDCGRVSFTALGNLDEAWNAFQKSGKEVAMPEATVLTDKDQKVSNL